MRTVFISSTFRDMHPERDVLLEKTIPALNAKAMAHGDAVAACDLRWGVDTTDLDSEIVNRKVCEVCLDEIDRSTSPMVVILGERYGWIPPEATVKDLAESRAMQLEDLQTSVTNLEIEYGAFTRQLNTLFYYREVVGDAPTGYGPEDELHAQKLKDLKQRIADAFQGNLKTYTVRYVNGQADQRDLDAFHRMVYGDIERLLEPQWEEEADESPEARSLRLEMQAHRRFVEMKASSFCAKRDELERAIRLIETGKRLIILKGREGVGKSTLFGALAMDLEARDWNAIPISCSLTQKSSDATSLTMLLIRRLEAELGEEHKSVSDAAIEGGQGARGGYADALKLRYLELCAKLASRGGRYVIMLDAVDQLAIDETRDSFLFVPRSSLGDQLRFVMTCQPELDTRTLEVSEGLPTDQDATVLLVDALDEGEKRMIIHEILDRHRKSLAEVVIDTLVSQKGSDTPLYLSLMIQRLMIMDIHDFEAINRRGGSMEEINKYQIELIESAPDSLEQVSALLIEEVGKRFRPKLMRKVLILMGLSRYGLRLNDLATLCSDEWNYLDFAYMYLYLSDSFFRRYDGRIDYVHRCFRSGVELLASKRERGLHSEILMYLSELPPSDPVRRSETLYHAEQSDDMRFLDRYIDEVVGRNDEHELQATAECLHDLCMASPEWIQTYIRSYRSRREGGHFFDFFISHVIDCFASEAREKTVLLDLLVLFITTWKTDKGTDGDYQRLKLYKHICSCLATLLVLGHDECKQMCSYAVDCARLTLHLCVDGRLSQDDALVALYHVMRCLDYSGDKGLVAEGLSIYDETLELGLYEHAPDSFMANYISLIAELHMKGPEDEQWRQLYEQAYRHGKKAYEASGTLAAITTYAHTLRCYATSLLFSSDGSLEARECLNEAIRLYDEHQAELLEFDNTPLLAWADCYGRLVVVDFVILMSTSERPNGSEEQKGHVQTLSREIVDATLSAATISRRFSRLFCDRSVDVSPNNHIEQYLSTLASIDPTALRQEAGKLVRFFDEMLRNDSLNAKLYKNAFWESTFMDSTDTSISTLVTLKNVNVRGVSKLLQKWYGKIKEYYQNEIESCHSAGDVLSQWAFLYQEANTLLLFDTQRSARDALSISLRALELLSRIREIGEYEIGFERVALNENLMGTCYSKLEDRKASYEHHRSAIEVVFDNTNLGRVSGADQTFLDYARSALLYAMRLEKKNELQEADILLSEVLERESIFEDAGNEELALTMCQVAHEYVKVCCDMGRAIDDERALDTQAGKMREIKVIASRAHGAYEQCLSNVKRLLDRESRIRETTRNVKTFASSDVTISENVATVDELYSYFTVSVFGGPLSVTETMNAILEAAKYLIWTYELEEGHFSSTDQMPSVGSVILVCQRALDLYEDVKYLYVPSRQSASLEEAQESHRIVSEFCIIGRENVESAHHAPARTSKWADYLARTKKNRNIARTLHRNKGELYKIGHGEFEEIQDHLIGGNYFTIPYYYYLWANQRGTRSDFHYDLNVAAYRIALGTRYRSRKKSLEEAFRAFRQAADQGQPMAMANMGYCYEHGLGTRRSKEKAVHWYKKALEHGNGWAAYRLSDMYLTGRLMKKDYDKAIEYFQSAVHIEGLEPVMSLYNSEHPDDHQDMADWLEGLVASGDAKATYRLGFVYETGYAIPRDALQSKEWYERAAAQGEVNAMRALGDGRMTDASHAKREERARNVAYALNWYKAAADGGDADSMCRIGDLLSRGRHSKSDYAEARKWYENSIEHGCDDGYVGLGRLYQKGLGVKRDRGQAMQLYREAEMMGNREGGRAADRLDYWRYGMFIILLLAIAASILLIQNDYEKREIQSFMNYAGAAIWTR